MNKYMENLKTEMTWAPRLGKILLWFLIILVNVQGSKECLDVERLGLLDIKDSFNAGGGLSSWVQDTESNCCSWERVRCNHNTGRITHLILEGLLPSYERLDVIRTMNFSLLLPFDQLMDLDLSDNHFTDSIEIEGLCKMKNLQELDISQNSIASLPECMSNLTSLRVLDLSSTFMIGNVPSFITNLKSLEYISLFDTALYGFFLFSLLANHSKLEAFRLSSINDNLHVVTESPPWLPTFQLKALQLGNCNLNAIPSFLLYQHELRLIDLSHNKLHGGFPTWLLENNSKLEILRLKNNSFTGTLQLPTSIHGLLNLGISSNEFGGQLPKDIGKIFPNLTNVNLAKNNFEGSLPSSLVEMQRVQRLHLSKNKFSGELAGNFFSNWTSLTLLSLSHNNFSGRVIQKFANFARLQFLFLNNNHFFGEIDDGVFNKSDLQVMDISSNMLSGRIPKWIGNFESLKHLSISKNLLEGEIPQEICNLKSIRYLDISENKLFGPLPICLSYLEMLMFLHLQKNSLRGYIPNQLNPRLYSLDLRDNEFFGEVPNMDHNPTGASFIRVLLLGGNQLSGSIPDSLCNLISLRIIDLSHNKFTGIIPSCLGSITFLEDPIDTCQTLPIGGPCVKNTMGVESIWLFPEDPIPLYNATLTLNYNSIDDKHVIIAPLPAEFRTKNNFYSYTGKILGLMSGLDLSSNELSSNIPPEIGHLGNIMALNLSHNYLSGTIPQSFSNLGHVESLDLSRNNLRGLIPPNLTKLHFLEIFNVSYNNLSGPTPTTGQFANFGEDNYRGNPGLFGFLNWSSMSPLAPPLETTSNEGRVYPTSIDLNSFYCGFFSSFITVVIGLAIILWFKTSWCRVWFRLVDLCIYFLFPMHFRNGLY